MTGSHLRPEYSAVPSAQEAPKPDVDADRAALMRRIAALAVAEDDGVLQQMQGQPGAQDDTQGGAAAAKPEMLQPPALRVSLVSASAPLGVASLQRSTLLRMCITWTVHIKFWMCGRSASSVLTAVEAVECAQRLSQQPRGCQRAAARDLPAGAAPCHPAEYTALTDGSLLQRMMMLLGQHAPR